MPLPLLPYQEQGAAYLAPRARAGLFDDMGVGKTAQAIRALDLRNATRGLVVCPAIGRENWRKEFAKFARIPRRLCKGVADLDFQSWANGAFDTLITSYEMATRWAPAIRKMCDPLDFAILDEGHYLKSPATARARSLLGPEADGIGGLLQWCSVAWWLTGTPIPNDPLDIWTFLRTMGAMPLSREDFRQRYFTSRMGTYSARSTPKPAMLPELRALLGNNSLRRTAEEVGLQLPPLWITTSVVDGDTQAVRDLLLAHPGLSDAIVAALQGEDGSLSKLDADHIATLRRLIGEAKAVPYAQSLVWDLQSGLDKMVVFGIHRDALALVHQVLRDNSIRSVLLRGGVSEEHQQAWCQEFQDDPDCRVLIANIRSAGTVLTFTASCFLDMLESDWAPYNNIQAIKRVHRMTQTRNVRARFIGLANSFDDTVNEIVAEKSRNIAAVQGGPLITSA